MNLLEWTNKNKKLIDNMLNHGRDMGNIDRMFAVRNLPELKAMAVKDGVNFTSWTCNWSN